MGLQSLWGAVERLSLTLMFIMLTTAAWADDVMYVIATELSGNITITQKNEDGGSSNLSVKKVKLTFYYGERPTSYAEGSEVWSQRTESFGGSCIFDVPTAVPTSNDYHYPAWYVNSSKNAAKRHEAVTQISFDASFAAARPKSTAYWFYNMKNLTSNIIDFTNLNTSSTKSMNHMFYGCQSIKNLDLSGWNVANVTDMGYMFYGCQSIQNLDLSGWNVAKVTNMSYMFYNCGLTSLNLSGWNVAQVTDMTRMFYQCSKLTTINLNGWNVTNLKRTSLMFSGCSALTNIYCEGSWDTNTLTIPNSQDMFKDCTSLPGYPSNPARSDLNKKKAKPQPDGYFSSIVLGTLTLDKNITASGYSTVEYDSKTYCYGTVTLGYTGTVPTGGIVKYAVNDEYIDGNTFTIRGDAKVTAVVVYPYTNISGLTYVGATTVISGTTYAMTSNGYYEIADEQDLIDLGNYAAANSTNKCYGLTFKLTADLDFSSRTTDDCQNGYGHGNYIPINDFYGTFNGQGHTITGLRFTSEADCGLFWVIVSPAEVKNVTLINPQFTGTSSVGGIAGYADGGKFESCTVAGGILSSTGESCGGILGWAKSKNYHVNITSCIVVNTSVSSPDNKGIILGGRDNGSYEVKCRKCCYHSPEGLPGRSDNPIDYNFFRVYQVTLGEGVTVTNEPEYAYGNKAYCQDAYTLTLGHNRPGYVFGGYQSDDVTITDGSFKMPEKDITVNGIWTVDPDFSGNSDDTEYTINNATGWDKFCDVLASNEKGIFTGKTVKLAPSSGNSISVTRMAGSSQHDFTGTFDGDGNTLTVDYNTSEQYAAPFRNAENGCVIENLHVAGTIATSAQNAAGVIANQFGSVTIRNCRSSVTIKSSVKGDGTHGGFVGVKGNSNSANLTIDGCVFDGKIISTGTDATTDCGGFVGYKGNKGSLTIKNCLYAPQTDANAVTTGSTFARNGGTITNCYYTQALGTAQGKFAHAVDAAPANLGKAVTEESITVLTAYENGILFDKKYYVAPQAVTLADNAANDLSGVNGYLADVTLQGRTLWKDGDWNTLVLPFDVEIKESVLDGADVRELADANLTGEVLTLNFTKEGAVSKIEAGKPYIIKWKEGENLVSPVFKGVTVKSGLTDFESSDGKVNFKGTYAPLSWTEETPSILFLGAGNKLHWPLDGAHLNAFRAYFELMGEAHAREFVMNFDGGSEETGIISLSKEPRSQGEADAWYTVNGVKLDGRPTAKGMYFRNGKKVVIK